ncbi:F-type H+-transporting ATPase subunit b [Clostridium acetobutylicum]|jgi:F-type H+-transporting ATPase subunit b|uniref:ATP synthase subunit b n=1 Tax=Clostridium acetobutylicum (strain ATCC 824 / DSM 792 / JCM 1419 / IAM 19013 / LMG 5710 / NBRC 13948 / NRRL B-527 / VKM B-1787 / 2291 / W) TaxID=272562 RepID=ATPF_CLOAB|nr:MULTISPECIES: F0F1 ATP synthase subunit B [Clostridium]O05098.1 RecName: Full=ATP synthase subunit b; AltName: Full=ATP synthase F(0) sector subunit b; AltName: Full=ATPase subunit I; AltName: Full=F-type ATPase subunit b; Short=F-ATPase subunit b [Clostridium acetobutylicum ATCC 824]AAB50193.1 F-type ATP synthase subunit b [Clostridium acetobutylicum ATCC 824]AAD16422.1 ATP synthase subunit b [Clostridium acetobutylicum ATCC 824]AAK80812.1 FoF1-type ATP synthase B subunit [Clostridium aceto
MEFNLVTIGFTIVNFIILMLILKHFFFDKVNKVIDDRNNEVALTIKKADAQNEEARLLKVESEKNLEDSKLQGKTIVENYKVKAEKVSEEITAEAKTEAQNILERAKRETQREKEKAEDEIKNQVVELAVLISSKALENSINEAEHRKLIEDFVSKVGI